MNTTEAACICGDEDCRLWMEHGFPSQPSPASSTVGEVLHADQWGLYGLGFDAHTGGFSSMIARKGEEELIFTKWEVLAALSPSSGEPAKEEPTAKGDRVAGLMRDYFEAHKKDKWDGFSADHLMGGLLNIVRREYRLVEPASVAGESDVRHLAAILEEWDHKDPYNGGTGHAYEDIARDALTRLALSKPTPVEAGLRERELIARFRDAVANVPYIIERVAGGQQFNAYESADDDDEEVEDEDREYRLCIGPISNARFIADVEGYSRAQVIEAALKLASHVAFNPAALSETLPSKEGEQ